MLEYVEQLYAKENAKEMPHVPQEVTIDAPIDKLMMEKGLRKLANGKAPDTLNFTSEMIKWTRKKAREWIHHLLNKAITHGLPDDWTRN